MGSQRLRVDVGSLPMVLAGLSLALYTTVAGQAASAQTRRPPGTPGAPASIRPEPFEVFGTSFEFYPVQEVEDAEPGTFEERVEVEVSRFAVSLALPVQLGGGGGDRGRREDRGDRTLVVNGVSYSFLHFSYEDWDFEAAPYRPEWLHALRYQIGLRRGFGGGWRLEARARPGLVSDFENIEANHINFDGGLLLSRRQSRTRSVGFGVLLLNDFGQPLVLPAFLWSWAWSARQRLDLLLPRRAAWSYFFSTRARIALVASIQGDHYRIGDELAPREDATLKYSVLRIGPAASRALGRHYEVTVDAGGALLRRFELRDEDGDTLRDLDLDPAVYIRAAISLRR